MTANYSFWDHWKRGTLAYLIFGLVVLGAGMLSAIIVGMIFVAIELFISSGAAQALEDRYLIPAIVILTCLLAPYGLSENAKRIGLVLPSIKAPSQGGSQP